MRVQRCGRAKTISFIYIVLNVKMIKLLSAARNGREKKGLWWRGGNGRGESHRSTGTYGYFETCDY